ncbi:MAG: DUF922 domain-containing protein [Pseudomonadales bacterium]|nr:DUF922 domain-containing Zn-dependent protease [Gammaproteobacteria bacterium]NNL57710.1 DUF922 domain-containing protein [Pseudomonadales bacterium]
MHETLRYYPVVAQSLDTLLLALASEVPERPGGKIYHGYTHSEVGWRWQFANRAGGCRMLNVQADVQNTITLPELQGPTGQSEAARVWRQWYPALRRHELQHANNAIEIARRGETRLLTLPPAKSCSALDERANRMVEQLIAELRDINAAYDRRTKHGETEGASLLSYKQERIKAGAQ